MSYRSYTHAATRTVNKDAALRAYMLKVYTYMAFGILATGSVAFFVSTSPVLVSLFVLSPLSWIFVLAPVGIAFFLTGAMHRITPSTAQALFWVYASVLGVSLSSLFLVFKPDSILRAFLSSGSMFGAMSLYGYTTKKDLTAWHSFLIMGLFGIMIAGFLNIFMHSNALSFAVSCLSVLLFAGLTAYDTQNIRDTYFYVERNPAIAEKTAIFGALRLYMDFINIFIHILQLTGERR